MITNRTGDRCEACCQTADAPTGRRLELHERWIYDEPTRLQTLRRLICLYNQCHTVTHFGLGQIEVRQPSYYSSSAGWSVQRRLGPALTGCQG